MPEHISPWRVSDAQSYEALRNEARRRIAESLAALRAGVATESSTELTIRRTRNEIFELGWSSWRDAELC